MMELKPFDLNLAMFGLIFAFLTASHAFNLDTQLPLLKQSSQRRGTYFGYAVALHRSGSGRTWLLAGAPRGRNLQPGTRRSGALFKCPFTPDIQDCEQVPTDGLRVWNASSALYGAFDSALTQLAPPVNYELKEDQWMGVAVASQGQGGKVIVCAHRYTVRDVSPYSQRIKDTKRGMLGLCYVLDSDLTFPLASDMGHKNVVVVRDAVGGKRLAPKPNFDDHAQWGMCQLGTQAIFVEDTEHAFGEGDDVGDAALFGAPGCLAWRGNVFVQQVGTIRRYDQAMNEPSNEFDKHGHLGLSIASGKFFGQSVIASGAPHASQGKGKIHFFTKDPRLDNGLRHLQQKTLIGDQFGAGFGYSLAVLDLNGDGEDDLLVGAPFDPSGGAVHVFISGQSLIMTVVGAEKESQFGLALAKLGDLNKDKLDDFVVGAPYEESGVVYVFLGAPDGLKTSNPGHEDNKKIMRVLCKEVASQIIRGDAMSSTLASVLNSRPIRTFGAALSSSGFDADQNGYPDLLIGAFESDVMLLLRARPIIDIVSYVDGSNLDNVDVGQKGCAADAAEQELTCFSFQICFSVDTQRQRLRNRSLRIQFEVEAEPEKSLARVLLKSDIRAESSKLVRKIIDIESDNEHCDQIVAYISSMATDLQSPMQFSLNFSLVQQTPLMEYRRGALVPDMNKFPILDQVQARKRFWATFKRDCGQDELCQAQIEIQALLRDSHKELRRTQAGYYEMELGSLVDNELVLEIIVKNLNEPAYLATLDVHFPSQALSYIGMGVLGDEDEKKYVRVNAPEVRNSSWLHFDLANPFGRNQIVRLPVRFYPKSSLSLKVLQFYLNANTTSVLTTDPSTYVRAIVVRRAEIRVIGAGSPDHLNLRLAGNVRGESDFHQLNELGPQIIHRYLVRNDGPSPLELVSVEVKWPFQVQAESKEGKWLLYLAEQPLLKNGRGHCQLPEGIEANPLKLKNGRRGGARDRRQNGTGSDNGSAGTGNGSRIRRSPELIVASERRLYDDRYESLVTFDCELGSAKCLRIECQIYGLNVGSSATVEIRARLWNNTLLEDYVEIDRINVVSRAKLQVDQDVTQEVHNDHAFVRTSIALSRPDSQKEQRSVWWIWLISVIIGLLILVLIALLLWYIGFFKRNRPQREEDEDDLTDLMLSANLEKARIS